MQKLAVFHLIPKHSLNINLLCIFFMNYFAPFKGIWIPKSGKFLFMESGILGFGISNTAQEIPNPTNDDWNSESKFLRQRLKSCTWNPESTAWNPKSNTVLDSLTRGELLMNVRNYFNVNA